MKKIFISILILLLVFNNNTLSLQKSNTCGNKSCEVGESIDNCQSDCNLFQANNNGVCGFQENVKNSPADCDINCGDGICESSEIYKCPKDCLGSDGGLLTKEKTNVNSAVMYYYNVSHSIRETKPYMAYIKNNKVLDYYFDTFVVIDRYFMAYNIDEWLQFIDFNFVDNFSYTCKWLQKEDNSNIAVIGANADVKSNAFYQKLYLTKGKYKITYYIKANTEKYNDFVMGIVFYDSNNKQVISNNVGLTYSSFLNSYFKYPVLSLNNWKKQEVIFNVPDNVKYAKIYFQSINDTGTFKIDNISLENIEKTGENLISNGDFENNNKDWKNLYPKKNKPYILHDEEDAPLKILNSMMQEVNNELNKNNKLKIIFTIPWGYHLFQKGMKEFNDLYKSREYQKRAELFKVSLKRYIDRTLELWSKYNFKNLELIGFYLDDEGASPLSTQEEWLSYIHKYINSKNLKLYASPYNSAPYNEEIKSFLKKSYTGSNSWDKNLYRYIDGMWTQPNVWPPTYQWSKNYEENKNYSFPHRINNKDVKDILPNEKVNPNDPSSPNKDIPASNFCTYVNSKIIAENGIPICELSKTITFAYRNKIGVEIEWVKGLEENIAYGRGNYGRVRDYLSYLIDYGFLKSSFLFFEGGFLLECFNSNNQVYRNQYDEVYSFIVAIRR
jgi:hypothetical protein